MLATVPTPPTATAPLRVGTTSHIYPGGWLANARRLAFRVRDLNLLCFDTQSLPDRTELEGLSEIGARSGLSYTLHLPSLPALTGDSWLGRRRAMSALRRIVTHTRALAPSAYVVHVLETCGAPNATTEIWHKRAATAVRRLIAAGIEPRRLCLSWHHTDERPVASLLDRYDVSLSLDVSRWDGDDASLRRHLEQYLPRVRVIEWHGVDPDGRDHRSVTQFPTETAEWLLSTLRARAYEGVLTLKVLSERDFEESMDFVSSHLNRIDEALPKSTTHGDRGAP